MSKPVKGLIVDVYKNRFDGVEGAVIIDIRGIPANENHQLRNVLGEQQIKMTLIKNSLAQRAWEGTALQSLSSLLQGSCAVTYGGTSVVDIARLLVEQAKSIKLAFKGAIMEGELFGAEQIDALSKFPTRDEAQGQVIQVMLSPAGQIIGAGTSAGAAIASILEAIEEKLNSEETIQRIA